MLIDKRHAKSPGNAGSVLFRRTPRAEDLQAVEGEASRNDLGFKNRTTILSDRCQSVVEPVYDRTISEAARLYNPEAHQHAALLRLRLLFQLQ
jgi:hypothetical protein